MLTDDRLTMRLLAWTIALAAGPAWAQPAEPDAAEATPAVADEAEAAEAEEEDDRVVVTGTRTTVRYVDAALPVEVVDRKDIEASGAMSLGDLLQTQGSVRIERTFSGAGVALRGLDARHTLILVDGQRLVGRVEGAIDLDRYPTEQIERIEIVRGAGSAVHGADAVGGVINIITRSAKTPFEAELTASGGMLGQIDATAHVGGTVGPVRTRWTAGHHRQDAFRHDEGVASTSGAAQQMTTIGQKTQIALAKRDELFVAGEYTTRRREAVDSGNGGAVFDRTQLTDMLTARLGYEAKRDGGLRTLVRLDGNLHRDQLARDQRRSGALDSVQETRIGQVGLTGQVDKVWGSHRVTLGVEGLAEGAESPRFADGEGSRLRGAVYAQDEWLLAPEPYAVLIAGARVDTDSRFGAFASPRLALRFDPHEDVAVQGAVGMGFRAPEFTEMLLFFENPGVGYQVSGTLDLEPERAVTADLGTTWRPTRSVEARVAGFFTRVDNLIQLVAAGQPEPGALQVYRYDNVAKAMTAGAELGARYRGRYGSVGANYTFTHTRDLDLERPLDGQPAHQASGEVTGKIPTWGVSLTVRGAWNGERPFFLVLGEDGDSRENAPAYFTMDARLAWRAHKRLELFAVGQNLTDAGDPRWLAVPPIRFAGGLTARY